MYRYMHVIICWFNFFFLKYLFNSSIKSYQAGFTIEFSFCTHFFIDDCGIAEGLEGRGDFSPKIC